VLLRTDPQGDVALVKIVGGRGDLPAVRLGDSDSLKKGD
jgi:S1-C subfamily serine protease